MAAAIFADFYRGATMTVAASHRTIVATCALCAAVLMPAYGGDESVQGNTPVGTKCEVAVVNPVSGYAECVKPRGAPVEPPPPRPPPTSDECRKHPDLDLESCRRTEPPPEH